ncbi:FHIPEP family type III secretion protein [Escherichia coli]|nr:FHIPEP family type III secretion protein [Escherichia coli]EFB5439573.1 FHIPEP family type III secretion protein [Escherichia coli]
MLSRSDLLTLLTINFIVVTKGAERISEVSARFTLDAMPVSRWRLTPILMPG